MRLATTTLIACLVTALALAAPARAEPIVACDAAWTMHTADVACEGSGAGGAIETDACPEFLICLDPPLASCHVEVEVGSEPSPRCAHPAVPR